MELRPYKTLAAALGVALGGFGAVEMAPSASGAWSAPQLTLAIETAAANEHQRELALENFLQADANADGALTFGEFAALIDLNAEDNLGRARLVARMNRYEMAFGRADANADGVVTPEEIAELAERAQQ